MERHIEPTPDAVRQFVERAVPGPVVMLNLLRFRQVADYSRSPELRPDEDVTGAEAYQRYAQHTAPFLSEVGGEVVFAGRGGHALIGGEDERWDLVLLVRYPSTEAFIQMTTNEQYLAGTGHRTAALEDSRLVPIEAEASFS